MLLLDLGNSAIKAQWWRDDELQNSFSCRFKTGWLARFKAYLGLVKAGRAYYSSVLGEQAEVEFIESLGQIFDVDKMVKFISLKSSHGVRNAYPVAEGLGVDRWLCLLGAAARVRQDIVIIDAGSAITIDLMRADGQHLGGAILPGFNTTIAGFKQIMRTANFDHPDILKTDEPGCSTEACIHIDYGSTDPLIVRQLVDRWIERLAADAVVIVTGGDASRIEKHARHRFLIMPDLVFHGMRRQLESQQ
ncbi:MAG: type III pantothenate kinase [Gammaproteobacteria bacterium]|nr:type III pantothenate kinase [Gammaproteobacteria bacterium]